MLGCWAADFVSTPLIVQTLVKQVRANVQAEIQIALIENMVFIASQAGLSNRQFE
ncbi:MAG: hypothetical protein ACI936_001298 [Paraglaciecola sp.]|jgi:hypothetical protein